MEVFAFNGLVAESKSKVQENFFLPVEVKAVVDPLIERHGRKSKWMFYTAAILALLEKGEVGIGERVGQIASAQHTGGIGKLLTAVTANRFKISQGGIDAVKPRRTGGNQSTPAPPAPPAPEEHQGKGKGRKG